MKKLKTLKGEEAVKFENFMHTGDLDVERELHEDIEPKIDKSNFIVQIWGSEKGLFYEYADTSTNLNIEGNWSQDSYIVGIKNTEHLEEIMLEVSFKEVENESE